MTPEDMMDFVARLYAATGVGDWEGAAAMLTEDFVAHESDAMPMAGEYRGKGGLKTLFDKVMGMVDVASLDHVGLTAGGDIAIAVLEMRFADPSLKPAQLCELFRFRDGKCCEIKPYYYEPAVFHAAVKAKSATV